MVQRKNGETEKDCAGGEREKQRMNNVRKCVYVLATQILDSAIELAVATIPAE